MKKIQILNIEMHYLFYNTAYGQKMESLFFAPYLKGSQILNYKVNNLLHFYSKFKIAIAFC